MKVELDFPAVDAQKLGIIRFHNRLNLIGGWMFDTTPDMLYVDIPGEHMNQCCNVYTRNWYYSLSLFCLLRCKFDHTQRPIDKITWTRYLRDN